MNINKQVDFLVGAVEGFNLSVEETANFLCDLTVSYGNNPEGAFLFCRNARHTNGGDEMTSASVLRHFLPAQACEYRAQISLLIIYSATSTEQERAKAQYVLNTCLSHTHPGGSEFSGLMKEYGIKLHRDVPTKEQLDLHPKSKSTDIETAKSSFSGFDWQTLFNDKIKEHEAQHSLVRKNNIDTYKSGLIRELAEEMGLPVYNLPMSKNIFSKT